MLKAAKSCLIEFTTNILSPDSVPDAVLGSGQAEILEREKVLEKPLVRVRQLCTRHPS